MRKAELGEQQGGLQTPRAAFEASGRSAGCALSWGCPAPQLPLL